MYNNRINPYYCVEIALSCYPADSTQAIAKLVFHGDVLCNMDKPTWGTPTFGFIHIAQTKLRENEFRNRLRGSHIERSAMAKSQSQRILVTPSAYAREHYLYVQEVGSLQSLEPHISSRKNLNSYLFFVVLSGSGTLTCKGRAQNLKSGDCAFIDCRRPYAHESSNDDPWRLTWVHFNGRDAEHFYEAYLEQGHDFFFHPVSILPFVETISRLYEISRDRSFLSELVAHRSLTELITDIYTTQDQKSDTVPGKLRQIREYIDLHYAERITLDSLSELFYISKYHMSREYRQAYGTTIVNDITAKRISRAKSGLRFTSDPVERIAEDNGFQDSAYFIHVFKKAEGMTPLQYRKKWKS